MGIAQHVAISRNDEAGTDTALHFLLLRHGATAAARPLLARRWHGAAKEATQEFLHFLLILAARAGRSHLQALGGADIHHGRANGVDQVREIRQFHGRHGGLRLWRQAEHGRGEKDASRTEQ